MNKLIDLAVEHTRTVLMILVLLLISGATTYISIPREADPAVDIPVLNVQARLNGLSPTDAVRLLIAPLEVELKSVEGVQDIYSTGYEGGATVSLEFSAGFEADEARAQVVEAVERAYPDLPDGTGTPEVEEVNTSKFSQLSIGLGGPVPERALYILADELKNSLESLPGVLRANLKGKREEMVEIIVDPAILESYDISPEDLATAVNRNNEQVAAGVMDSGVGRFALKIPGNIEAAGELLELPIKSIQGNIVRMRDIATVRQIFKDAANIARVDGRPAIVLEIKKRSGANVVQTIDRAKAEVRKLQESWPQGLEVSYFGDRSIEIRDVLKDLENSVLLAVLLVVIVVLGTMGLRSAFLVGVAIPGSFVIGILAVGLLGLTVNIVVLFALIMSVGLLVDGAIVVTEHADKQMLSGTPAAKAYREASHRMALPIMTSTATTLAAFLPLLFWPGVVGEFMKFLPITLIATLTASLLMALVFVPTLGAAIASRSNTNAASPKPFGRFTTAYARFLSRAVRLPGTTLLVIACLLFCIVGVYSKINHGAEFFPQVEPDKADVTVLARGDLSVRERDYLLREVENELLAIPEIKTVYSRTKTDDNEVAGSITLEFTDWNKRERRVAEVLPQVRKLEQLIPGLKLEIQTKNAGPGGSSKPILIEFVSDSNQDAMDTVDHIQQWMLEHGGFTDIEHSLPERGIEWNIKVDRQEAARYGADVSLVSTYAQLITDGAKLSSFRPDDAADELDIIVRFAPEYRELSQLKNMRVSTAYGYVPLSNFASIEPGPRVTSLERLNGQAVHSVLATPIARTTEEASLNVGQLLNKRQKELDNEVANMQIIEGVAQNYGGHEEGKSESQIFLIQAMSTALFIMVIILVTQFNSFYHMLLTLSSVIVSLGGVLVGLMVMGQPFSLIMSGVAVIALAGIVVNNNIVLIDTYNQLVKNGTSAIDAAIGAGVLRLRPVLLTSITTILGLMPMALQFSIDLFSREITIGSPSTQWWSQLATTIVGGLTFATLLTLVLTPCLLTYPTIYKARRQVDQLKEKLH